MQNSLLGKVVLGNAVFFVPYVVLSLILLMLLVFFGNNDMFLFVNRHYSTFSDYAFLYITILGDGVVASLLILVFLRVSFRDALTFLIITLVIAVIVNITKKHIFPELVRPLIFFADSHLLHLVPGHAPLRYRTFPSGHTAIIFSMCSYLSFLAQKRNVKLILFLIACVVSYSRIYLAYHFPADIVVGAFFGITITLLGYVLSRKWKKSWLDYCIVFKPRIGIRKSRYAVSG